MEQREKETNMYHGTEREGDKHVSWNRERRRQIWIMGQRERQTNMYRETDKYVSGDREETNVYWETETDKYVLGDREIETNMYRKTDRDK